MAKQSITVVRDWHPVRRAVAAGAMSVVLASAMALPAFAAERIDYFAGDDHYSETAAFNDEANGISWDGKDAITLNSANLGDVDIEGNSVITLTGESTIVSIDTMGGDLTLVGDVDVPAEEKPILNVGEDGEDGGGWIDTLSYTGAEDNTQANGSLSIQGLTVNFVAVFNYIDTDSLTIDNSKVVVSDVEEQELAIFAKGTTDIVESVVDLGTGGMICSQGVLTIDNSDVSVRAREGKTYTDDNPYTAIHSHADVVLKNEANGEVKTFVEDEEYTYHYVDTGDKNAVFLKAASTPGYYTGKQAEAKAMPKTGDSVNPGAFAGMAALAAGALGALGLSRKRGQSEE